MLSKLIDVSTDFLIRHQIIDPDDRDVYEYGFHALYNNIFDIASIIVIALLLHQVPQTLVYHIAFIPMRSSAGGYHTATHTQCFLASTAIWLLSLWGITLAGPALPIGLAAFSCLLVWVKAPVEHENNPMSERKYKRMKYLCRTLSTLFLGLVILITIYADASYQWLPASLAFGVFSQALLMTAALIQLKRKPKSAQ